MKKHICLFLFSLFALMLSAERITRDQALVLAQDFMQGKVMEPVLTNSSKAPVRGGTNDESYYIFNADDNGGYAIIAADDRVSPVLGYSDQGNINPENMPENMASWLEFYKHEINSLKSDAGTATYTSVPRDEVKPLIINNYWHQKEPYNLLCPAYDGTRTVVGCVALSIAQIMYYYKWPVGVVDSIPPYINQYNSQIVEGLPSTTFKWDQIKPAYSKKETEENCYAVAELLRYCGQAVKMCYDVYGSASSSGYAAEALVERFGYSRQTEILYRDQYSSYDWEEIIYNELASGRPVYYTGIRTNDSGHAFVCDGYKDGFFHINWGQGGTTDGYFRLSLLSMETTFLYDKYNFGYWQEAIIGIEPRMENLDGKTFSDGNFDYTVLSDTSVMIQAIDDKDYYGIDTLWIPDHVDYQGNRYWVTRLGSGQNLNYDLKKVYLPSSLKQIDSEACFLQSIREFTIPSGIEVLSPSAFIYNDSLELFIVQKDSRYKAIDGVLFSHDMKEIICYPIGRKDTSYTVPDGVKIIGSRAFANNRHLSEITLPDCVEHINDNAFYVSQIKRINLPDSLISIGCQSFVYCQKLSDVILPPKIRTICNYAFYGCSSLKTIILPNSSVDCLPLAAFENCSSLESVHIKTEVESIHNNCFKGCSALKEIIIESAVPPVIESVSVFDESVYEKAILKVPADQINLYRNSDIWSGFKHIETIPAYTINGINYILDDYAKTALVCTGKEPYSGDVIIPATVEYNGLEYSVNAMQPATFAHCKNLTSVVIDAPVAVLPDSLFKDCSSLKAVTLNDHIKTIGDDLFYGCSVLETAYIPKSVAAIGESLFYGCKSLRTVTIPENIRYLGPHAFVGCNNLDSVTILGNLAGIGTNIFGGCQNLSYVSLPDNISCIGFFAFKGCGYLQTIAIPEGVTNIFDEAFCGCSSLSTIVLPDSLRYIGSQAFSNCHSLKSIKLPDGITFIGDNAFMGCISLDSIVIPKGVEKIQKATFDRCFNLKSIILPESITELDTYAFIECSSLTTITIPANVRRIGKCAFEDCRNMTSFYCQVEDPGQISLGEDAFNRINEECILYVPQGCSQAYKADERWTAFIDIRETGTTTVESVTQQVAVPVEYYNLSGARQSGLQRGINLIRFSDGTVRKVTQ